MPSGIARVTCLLVALLCQACSEDVYIGRTASGEVASTPGFAISLIPTGSSTLSYGQSIGFRLESVRDGFAHLYSIDASGRVMAWAENLPIRKGIAVTYPRPEDDLVIRANPPAGEECVILLVTERNLAGFGDHSGRTATLPSALPLEPARFLKQLDDASHAQPDKSWARTEIWIRTIEPGQPAP